MSANNPQACGPREVVHRHGKWTITRAPSAPPPPPQYAFTHDEYDGAPDILDPRHGLGASVEDCLRKIAEIEARDAVVDMAPRGTADLYAAIHARLCAGGEPEALIVEMPGGALRLRWGVAGGDHLTCTADAGRELAAVMEREGYFPGLAELLCEAARRCDELADLYDRLEGAA